MSWVIYLEKGMIGLKKGTPLRMDVQTVIAFFLIFLKHEMMVLKKIEA